MQRRYIGAVLGALAALGLLLPSAAHAERVKIKAARLTVRAGPGKQHKRIGSAPRGRVYEVRERKGAWVAIAFGSGRGWVFGRFVRTITGDPPSADRSPPSQTATHSVLATRLNVRSRASVKGKLRFRLRRGARVSVLESKGSWRRITHRGRTGWVMGKYLVVGKAPPPRRRPRRNSRKRKRKRKHQR